MRGHSTKNGNKTPYDEMSCRTLNPMGILLPPDRSDCVDGASKNVLALFSSFYLSQAFFMATTKINQDKQRNYA